MTSKDCCKKCGHYNYFKGYVCKCDCHTPETKGEWEEKLAPKAGDGCYCDKLGYTGYAHNQNCEEITHLLETEREKEREEIWDALINSLPGDAENLSTLTGWQAQHVVSKFMEFLQASLLTKHQV